MKKDDVYKLIEYNGVYDEKIKKNLKKLIKKYHPDKNKKDKKTIEIIYEVKKELESNKVSYSVKKEVKKKKNDFISKDECINSIAKLSMLANVNDEKLKKEYDELSLIFEKYEKIYKKYYERKNYLCKLIDQLNNIKKINFLLNLFYLVILCLLVIHIIFIKNNFFIIIIIFLSVILYLLYNNNSKLKFINKKIYNNTLVLKKKLDEIKFIQEEIKKKNDDIYAIERENNSIKDNIRFYQNMKDK